MIRVSTPKPCRSPVSARTSAVIRAEPDAYNMAQQRLMGRQAAGHGFLRAAVAARDGGIVRGIASTSAAGKGFGEIVRRIDPAAPVEALTYDQIDRVSDTGVLYLADITISQHARLRLRTGVAGFSLCGVTHTTASAGAMDELVGILREPVMPWDALVCTTGAVAETVRRVHEAEADYLRWRFGQHIRTELPQLPVIPLGVHCGDFEIADAARAAARTALGLGPDTVAALFVGRLVYHAKAHPFAMYTGLEAAARRTGRPVALLMCGWAPNDAIAQAFISGAAEFAPSVRTIFVEGRDFARRDEAWAAADIFVSLSDNIQETFGLTPVEAMAAGLPVVATDWNGYRDTVRADVDGYRVRTWAPMPGGGMPIARGHENGLFSYDQYCWSAATTTAIDLDQVTQALTGLIESPDLRRRLGEAGRRHARDHFDWPVVYARYQELWADLNARRAHALADPASAARFTAAPTAAAARLDPFYAFGHYPTGHIGPATRLAAAPGASPERLQALCGHPLFSMLPAPKAQLAALLALALAADVSVQDASERLPLNLPATVRATGILAKMGLVRLG